MNLGKILITEGKIVYEGKEEESPLNNIYSLMKMLQEIIKECELTILDVSYHQFKPFGVTVLYLLSESHISIHTWPESNKFALDVYSCKDGYDSDNISNIIKAHLEIEEIKHIEFIRDI